MLNLLLIIIFLRFIWFTDKVMILQLMIVFARQLAQRIILLSTFLIIRLTVLVTGLSQLLLLRLIVPVMELIRTII